MAPSSGLGASADPEAFAVGGFPAGEELGGPAEFGVALFAAAGIVPAGGVAGCASGVIEGVVDVGGAGGGTDVAAEEDG